MLALASDELKSKLLLHRAVNVAELYGQAAAACPNTHRLCMLIETGEDVGDVQAVLRRILPLLEQLTDLYLLCNEHRSIILAHTIQPSRR